MATKDDSLESHPFVRATHLGPLTLVALLAIAVSIWFTVSGESDSAANESLVVLSEDKGHLFVAPDDLDQLRISHTFRLINTTDSQWELEFVGSSCGCTKPTFGDTKLQPGATTDLTVTIEAGGRTGHVAEYVQIKTGAMELPNVRGYLQADIHPLLLLSGVPATPVSVEAGGKKTLKLEVRSEQMIRDGQQYPELAGLPSSTYEANLGSPVVTEVDNLTRVIRCPLSVDLIAPSVVTDLDYSVRSQQIEVECGTYRVSKKIAWQVVSPIESRPRVVFMQRGAGKATRQLVLTSDSEFSLLSFEASDDSLSVDLNTDVRSRSHVTTINVSGAEDSTKRKRFETGKIVFRTDHPQQREVSVAVQFMAL